MARHELRRPARQPVWRGRGPLIALSAAVVGVVVLGVTTGPVVLAGHPIRGVPMSGSVSVPPNPFHRS